MGNSKKQDIRFVMPNDASPHGNEPLLTICGDLICFPEKKDMVSRIGILGTKCFDKRPDKCPSCNRDAIMGVEVLGALEDCKKGSILIWQCMKCDERYLKYHSAFTNLILDEVRDTYTVPDDWGYQPRSEFS